MKVTINGKSGEFAQEVKLGHVLREFGIALRGIAVAVNASIVTRAAIEEYALGEGDVVEIIHAVAGG